MNKQGIAEFLTSLKLSEKQLKAFLVTMGLEAKEGAKKSDMITLMQTEILYFGLSAIFSNCTVKQLQTFAKDLGLSIESSAKTVLLRCILAMTNYTAADKPKVNRKPKEPKKKKEEGSDEEMVDDDPTIPRGPPPKFDWEVSDDSDSEEFKVVPSPLDEDVEMSDVASENEEKVKKSEASEESEGDGSEYAGGGAHTDSDDD